MRCYLMNQNQPFLDVEFEQNEIKKINEIINIKYAPLQLENACNTRGKTLLTETYNWYKSRGIPSHRKELNELLKKIKCTKPHGTIR